MIKPSINDVLEKISNRYYLVGTVSKRARQIIDDSNSKETKKDETKKIVDLKDIIYVENKQGENKPVCIAAQEVAEGKITYRELTQEEIEQQEIKHQEEQKLRQKELEENK